MITDTDLMCKTETSVTAKRSISGSPSTSGMPQVFIDTVKVKIACMHRILANTEVLLFSHYAYKTVQVVQDRNI